MCILSFRTHGRFDLILYKKMQQIDKRVIGGRTYIISSKCVLSCKEEIATILIFTEGFPKISHEKQTLPHRKAGLPWILCELPVI